MLFFWIFLGFDESLQFLWSVHEFAGSRARVSVTTDQVNTIEEMMKATITITTIMHTTMMTTVLTLTTTMTTNDDDSEDKK